MYMATSFLVVTTAPGWRRRRSLCWVSSGTSQERYKTATLERCYLHEITHNQ
jgi:hypothetical protein